MSCKKVVFKNFVKLTGKNLFLFLFLQAYNVIKKETPSQVFSYQFYDIFKNIFFIEHLRWLLLPTLKPLDSLRQLCKWISKLVTVYFISTFLVLVGIFMFIFGEHKLSFYISIVLWSCSYDVFYFSRDFLGGAPSSWFSTLPSFGGHEPCKCGHKFFFFTWPRDWCVKWLCGLSPLILSHHLAKFGVHRPCGSGDKRFLFVTWPRYRSVTWLVGWGPLILNHHPARFWCNWK